MGPSRRRGNSGKWVVIGIVLLAVILSLLALKFRIDQERRPTTAPSTLPIAQDGADQTLQR